MSPHNATLTVNSAECRDDELFTAPSSDPTPDRHPSILRPGGHASPLKYPAVLRPGVAGVARRSRTPSPNGDITTSPAPHPQQASSPPVTYRAYSPPRPQSPSDELSAEIEGYFTALEVPPLNINKPQSSQPVRIPTPEQRCASPPVPPKEPMSIELEDHVVSPVSELEAPTSSHEDDHHNDSASSEPVGRAEEADECSGPPPAYDESQRATPPPEKASAPHQINDIGLAGAAAASAAQVGGAVAGVDADEAIAGPSTGEAAMSSSAPAAEAGEHPENDGAANDQGAPPPLPPRPSPSPSGKGKQAAMPGAFPAPPTRPVSPSYKASGAAATSAASVGAAVAGVGQSAGLKQARKALEKRIGHMIDKAKEHHHAREQHGHEKKHSAKSSSEGGNKKKRVTNSAPLAEVSPDMSMLGLRAGAEYLLV